ncbi:MarR family winged helix-turn-helix transcriptional regulator [Paeniglutamicibacter cryotolerans]|uniref:DNA-binding MarR family transcriptional regulator n=1 Tax=Paeniglutamicibacter cryotolerans TaxID=670079 RepID=A0A839QME0_9MICC|nr:MarR family transcriptional regulator [Paeniglutamicibacter cryotolerans]MBB2996930.1 DNA-binding MarR family transcriptional regulator [Paeniglutamicibacter cryotolerans]
MAGFKTLAQLQYELMLFSRYHLRPHHNDEPLLERSAQVLLSRMEHVEPMTLKELSRALRLDASTIHRQTAALLRQGYLEYAQHQPGEVARRMAPTAEGLAMLDSTRGALREGIEKVVGRWPEEKGELFAALLREFNEGVEQLEGTSWPRTRA